MNGESGSPAAAGEHRPVRERDRFPRPIVGVAVGAVLLRLALLLGRGDYLAFDEGWYLLLARSLFTGDGYTLIGTPHITLSPLFPILAGAVGDFIGSWVWGGRLVAAVASGLLVLPAWAVFRRLAPERTALIAVALIAVLPPLAPFVVPFWIGADLWVGAEPLLHLLLYTGIAVWVKADEHVGMAAFAGSGIAFGLAFLARPEAVITWGFLGLATLGLAAARRSRRRLAGAAAMGVGFLLVAAPYWVHLHDVTGRWSITGRGVSMPGVTATAGSGDAGVSRSGSARTIERMLWQDDEAYRARLYGLDATGLGLRSDYWGVRPRRAAGPAGTQPRAAARQPAPAASDAAPAGPTGASLRTPPRPDLAPAPSALYVRALGMILPLLLWPLALLGLAQPRGRAVLRREVPVTAALLGTSLAVALVVAIDPRTQLFLVPLLAFYAARGFSLIEDTLRSRWTDSPLRPGFIQGTLAAVAVVWLLGIDGRRLYLSLALGSPHHIVAEQNRAVAEELDALLEGQDGPIASWHPAIAVWADRDWKVLPFTDLPGIVRYLDHAGAEAAVLSAYYPPDLGVEKLGTRYLVLPIPESGGARRPWEVHLVRGDSIRALGRLEPGAVDSAGAR